MMTPHISAQLCAPQNSTDNHGISWYAYFIYEHCSTTTMPQCSLLHTLHSLMDLKWGTKRPVTHWLTAYSYHKETCLHVNTGITQKSEVQLWFDNCQVQCNAYFQCNMASRWWSMPAKSKVLQDWNICVIYSVIKFCELENKADVNGFCRTVP
jgi:hypothetical protein